MQNIFKYIAIAIFAASCAPKQPLATLPPEAPAEDTLHYITLTAAQLAAETTPGEPMPILAAYRKMPGSPKIVSVKGHWRHARYGKDSVYIKEYQRSCPD